jgi:very-short-patch-repair endonuclease
MRHYTRKPRATAEGGRLRREVALVEQKLWVRLRAGALDGLTLSRQHRFGPYVVDFYCEPLKLAFEIAAEAEARNSARTRLLKDKGIKIVRVWSEPGDIAIDTTLEFMRHAVAERREEMGRGDAGDSSSMPPKPKRKANPKQS